jgi:choline dehydrogenase-like flavoprotein
MLIDAKDIEPGQQLDAQVCIMGAGPVGLTIARELIAQRIGVLILERGNGDTLGGPADDGLVLEPPYERVSAPRGRGVERDMPRFEPYPIGESRGRGIGGSSWKWAWGGAEHGWRAQLPPFDAADFAAQVPGLSGWPIDYAEFARHVDRAAEHCGLTPFESEAPTSWLAPHGIFAKRYRSGSSTVFWSNAADDVINSPHARLIANACVLELASGTDGNAIGTVRAASCPGREFVVRAERYVLACGGIDNARILLASRGPGHANGIGNASDMVGRCFMEHIGVDVGYFVPRDRKRLRDPGAYALHHRNGELVQLKYQLEPAVRRADGLPNVVYQFAPSRLTAREIAAWYARHLPGRRALAARRGELDSESGTLRAVLADAPGLIRGQAALLAGKVVRVIDKHPFALRVRASAEQYPDPACRVTLTERRDTFGVEIAALAWRISDADLDGLRASQQRLAEVLAREGVGTLYPLDVREDGSPPLGVGFHHMGTTRMSASPNDGVVDGDCRVHGVGNLYCAGSSVYPTGGSANPTFTAVTLAVRLGQHLATAARAPADVSVANGDQIQNEPAA